MRVKNKGTIEYDKRSYVIFVLLNMTIELLNMRKNKNATEYDKYNYQM